MLANTRPTVLGERFDRAVAYALDCHRTQVRKESGVPYAAHLLGVAAIALEFGADETEAIGALLHDAVEDCGGRPRLEDIRARFGEDVAVIVEGCTDSFEADAEAEKAPWYDRKRAYIDGLLAHDAGTGDGILLVSASDKLYNALATANDAIRTGPGVFDRFKSKKFGTLWYYRALASAYASHRGRQEQIAERLAAVVDALAGKHVTEGELLAAFAIDNAVDPRERGSLARDNA